MLFNSFNFWIIFPIIFIIYWLIPSSKITYRKLFLIIVSYLLYMNWIPAYALLLLGVTLITFYTAKIISSNNRRKFFIICLGVFLTILPLLIFKYYNFINNSITDFLNVLGLSWHLSGLNLAIPIGISFFTFQALGYLWDVYYGKSTVEKNLLDYILFVSFFPQIASGPISKPSELLPQIKSEQTFQYNTAVNGLKLLLWGMFLKVVVADRLGLYVNIVYDNYENYSSLTCALSSLFYSVQIYADFAGYSYMAIGIASLLGFKLINNFERPYMATSITEFWKRWHISLTRWLTTYIYIPLGGSRCSKLKHYSNIMITFLVSGLWHGANWTFIVWGGIHGVFQIIEKYFGISSKHCTENFENPNNFIHNFIKILRIIITFSIVNIAWIFFRMPTITDALNFIKKIFVFRDNTLFFDNTNNFLITLLVFIVVLAKDILGEFTKCNILNSNYSVVRWSTYIILFFSILLFGVLDSGQFIYVSF